MSESSSGPRPDGPSSGSPHASRRRALNVRLFIGTVVVVLALVPAGWAWHHHQMQRLAVVYRDKAEEFDAADSPLEAAGQWRLYLSVHPDDSKAQVRLAQSFGKGVLRVGDRSRLARAVNLLYEAAGLAEEQDQPAVRTLLAEALLASQRFTEAQAQADLVLKTHPRDKDAKRFRALALFGQVQAGTLTPERIKSAAIAVALEEALELQPGNPLLARLLADVYRTRPELLGEADQALDEPKRREKADAIVDGMVRADPENPEVLLARYDYRRRYGLPRAEEDLAAALKFAPDHETARLLAAESAVSQGRRLLEPASGAADPQAAKEKFQEAEAHLQHLLERSERPSPRVLLGLGNVRLLRDDVDGAIAAWQKGLAALAESPPSGQQAGLQYDLQKRLAEVLIRRGRFDEAKKALDALDAAVAPVVRAASSQEQKALHDALGNTNKFLRAQYLMGTNRAAEAAPLLEELAASSPSSSPQQTEVWRWLGACRAMARRPAEAAEAFEKVLATTPNLPAVRLAAANARRDAGQGEAALAHYERLLAETSEDSDFQSPDVWLSVAQLRLAQQRGNPPARRDWQPFLAALEKAGRTGASRPLQKPWHLPRLEAQYAFQKALDEGRREEGIKKVVALLEKAEPQFADEPEFQVSASQIYEVLGRREEADRALDRYAKLLPDQAQPWLLRAMTCERRGEPEQARKILEQAIETLRPAARPPIEFALIEFDQRHGAISQKEAYEKYAALSARMPDSQPLFVRMAQLAIQLDDAEAMLRCQRELERLEGPAGAMWRYCCGRRLLGEAEAGKTERLDEVERLLVELRRDHPNWAQTHVLAGTLHEMRGRLREAIDEYEKALQQGIRAAAVYERVVRLLYQTEQYDRAERYLAELGTAVPDSQGLSGVAIDLAVKRGEITAALEKARHTVTRRPDDPLARVWLAQVLVANGRVDDAEIELKKAVEMAPKQSVAREVLWRFYLGTGRLDLARDTLRELADKATLTDAKRALILAAGHGVLGAMSGNDQAEADRQKARELFVEAVRLAPDDPDATLGLARLQLSEDREAAEKLLTDFLNRNPGEHRVGRMLAWVKASRGGEAEWKEAEALLEQMSRSAESTDVDQRLLARLLVERGGRQNLIRAQGIVRKLIDEARVPTDGDRLLLAQIYDLQGEFQRARQQLAILTDEEKPNPAHVVAYADLLLRQRSLDEAAAQIERLEQLTSEDNPRAVLLRVQWLALQERPEEIEPLVEKAAQSWLAKVSQSQEQGSDARRRAEAAVAAQVGNIYASAKQYAAARRWFERLDEKDPGRWAGLAVSLAGQGQVRDAIALCEKAAESDATLRPAAVAVRALTLGKPKDADFQAAESFLAKVQKAHPDESALLVELGTVKILRGRDAEAAELYGQILAKDPRNVTAMNNLASVLAENPDRRKEAAEHIDRAIALAGPQAWLLDTKGWIALLSGDAETAVAILEEATAPAGADARFDLHLAAAYDRVGKTAESKKALEEAVKGHVHSQVLTATEARLLEELSRKHGS